MKTSGKFTEKYYREAFKREGLQKTALGEKILDYFDKKSFPCRFLKILKNLPHNAIIADLGCGAGATIRLLHVRRPDLKFYGLDVADQGKLLPDYANFIHLKNTKAIQKIKNKCDLVISSFVLEHLINADEHIAFANTLLKPQGYLFAITMNWTSLLTGAFLDDHSHIKPFTKFGLKKILAENNFSILKCQTKRDLLVILLTPYLLLKTMILLDGRALQTVITNILAPKIWIIGQKINNK